MFLVIFMKYSIKDMKDKLESNSFNFKKKFGQNFIIDENIINGIINKSDIDKDTMVIEIGPGSGSLTYKLCEYSKNVLCYEIDTTLKDILEDNLSSYDNKKIIFNDFLKSDVLNDIKDYDYKKLYVVANLPYYITTPIILKVIESKLDISSMVFMVQKEVAERFSAKPKTREYGSISVFLNYFYNIRNLFTVGKKCFYPVPNVDSAVIKLEKKDIILDVDINKFNKVVKDSFQFKRKNLRNNLKNYDIIKIEQLISKYGFSMNNRAEDLPYEVFVEIANNL